MANGLVRSDGKAIAARGDEEGTANEAHRVAVYGLMFKMAEALLDPKSPRAAIALPSFLTIPLATVISDALQ